MSCTPIGDSVVHPSSTANVGRRSDDDVVEFELFQEEFVLPIGSVLRGLKLVDRTKTLTHGLGFFCFIFLFVVISTLLRPVSTFFSAQRGLVQALAVAPILDARHSNQSFLAIHDDASLWAWAEGVLYPAVFQKAAAQRNGVAAIAGVNRLVSPIRFQQGRSKKDSCATPQENHAFSSPCWPELSCASVDKAAVANASAFIATKYVEEGACLFGLLDSPAGGHIVDLELDPSAALAKIQGMIRGRWTDEGTRTVSIRMNTYNPNIGFATALRFQADRALGGRFSSRVDVSSCRLAVYASTTDIIRACLEISWLLGYILYVAATGKRCWRRGCRSFFGKAGNCMDVIYLVCLLVVVIRWIEYVGRDRSSFLDSRATFKDLASVCDSWNGTANFSAFCLVWSVVHLFKFFLLYPQVSLIYEVLVHSFRPMAAFVIMMLLGICGFATTSSWLFGANIHGFSSLHSTVGLLVQSMMSGLAATRAGQAEAVQGLLGNKAWSPSAAIAWALVWLVLSSLVGVTLIVAILTNAFTFIRTRKANQERLQEAFPITPWVLYFQSKVFRYCNWLWTDPDLRDAIMHVIREDSAWVEALADVDGEVLQERILADVADGDRDFEVKDAMELFPHISDVTERYRHAAGWMKQLSVRTGVKMRRVQTKPTTQFEIHVLTQRLCRLEEEHCGLAIQLQNVLPSVPHTAEPI
eukprot:TRINITY_DN68597_c0_g1_i1.p1 TRINITY_DN68597_c0_g1~~TRINITY_DN68597_c0_g1_i1.p1  ORF type:complete len:696 (+),score=68.01 TRINITY_DN68597_c0_g1_i1:70-2157(+)